MGAQCSGLGLGAPKCEIDAKQAKKIAKAVKDTVDGSDDLKKLYDFVFTFKKDNNADWAVDKIHTEVLEDDSDYKDSGVAQDFTKLFDKTVGDIIKVVKAFGIDKDLVKQMDDNGGSKIPKAVKSKAAEKAINVACKKQLDKFLMKFRGTPIFSGEEPGDGGDDDE